MAAISEAINKALDKLSLSSSTPASSDPDASAATSSSKPSGAPAAAKLTIRNWRVTVLISGSGSNLQALLDALPTTLSNASVVSVLANKPGAFGLTRAANHSPSIPTTALSLKRFCEETPAHPFVPAAEAAASPEAKERLSVARKAYLLEFAKRVKETRPDLIVLAGWMLILSPEALDALTHDWEEGVGKPVNALETEGESPYLEPLVKGTPIPIINLHPALPGTFPGAHGIKDAWDAFNHPDGAKIQKTGIMIHRVIPELDAGPPVLVREVVMEKGESLEDLETRIHKVEHLAIVEAVSTVLGQLQDGSWWKPHVAEA